MKGSIVGKSFVSTFSNEETEVAEILLHLPNLILESEARRFRTLPFTWGSKRKRSAIDVSPSSAPPSRLPALPSSSSSPSLPLLHPETEDASPPQAKVEASSSPATPLSFSPSDESEDKPIIRQRKIPLKKREDLLKSVQILTNQNALLQREMDNVKRYYEQQKAFNLRLKQRRQELLSGGIRRENSYLENGFDLNHNSVNYLSYESQYTHHQTIPPASSIHHNHPLYISNQRIELTQIAHSSHYPSPATTSFFPTNSWGLGPDKLNNNMGTNVIPDLNVSVEECVPTDQSCQALDSSLANKNLNRLMAAEARKKRIQIYRLKNSILSNKKPRLSNR